MQLVEEVAAPPDDAVQALGDAIDALVRATMHASRHPAHAALPALELARLLEGGERRLGELAVQRGVGQSVVSRQIGELAARGLVVRRPDPADGRAGLVRLTPAGRDLLGRVARARHRWLQDALAPYADTDVRAAARLLTTLADELRHHFGEGQS
jgi:DNA-binding MarR family transcriptional regulator